MRLKPSVVDRFRDKRAQGWVQAAAFIEKNAAILGHGRLVLKKILKARQAGLSGMHALHRLRELHLIADQDDVDSGACHGDEIAERYLARFVYEQIIIFAP